MNQAEKINEYKSQRYYDMVQMQLFQWLRYWVDANPETIEREDLENANQVDCQHKSGHRTDHRLLKDFFVKLRVPDVP